MATLYSSSFGYYSVQNPFGTPIMPGSTSQFFPAGYDSSFINIPFDFDSTYKFSDLQFIKLYSILTKNQFSTKINWFGKLVIDVPATANKFKFDFNFNDPQGDLRAIAGIFQIPDNAIQNLLDEAVRKKGDKDWLKKWGKWIVDNWEKLAIIAGTAITILRDDNGNGVPGTNTPGYDPVTDIRTPSPDPGQSGLLDQIADFAKDNAIPIAGLGLAGFFILSDNKKKKRRR